MVLVNVKLYKNFDPETHRDVIYGMTCIEIEGIQPSPRNTELLVFVSNL